MNLIEALERLKLPVPPGAREFRIFLGCGFTPLHLQTFFAACFRQHTSAARLSIKTGLFGDLAGSIERIDPEGLDAAALVIEWDDLDPRLGIRSLGGWRTSDLPDILTSVEQQAGRLSHAVARLAASISVSICMPTLPLPPLFHTSIGHAGADELRLHRTIADLASRLAEQPTVRVVSPQYLDGISPLGERLDVRSGISAGFPYTLGHAFHVADALIALVSPPGPKKGLITDLDDTLWSGLVGEVGVDGISWSLEHRSHVHGLYQQFLSSLASAGTLLAIASKNDPEVVEQAFARNDLLVARDTFFPLEVHWNAKSESVARILSVWNIGPEAVTFIDDSPLEVAEVKAAFPEMECIVFPRGDYNAVWQLLLRLRQSFGKSDIREEDRLRLASIRNADSLRQATELPGHSIDEFLERVDAIITFATGTKAGDGRALELINKTNQFNLNGRRIDDARWRKRLADPEGFVLTASYRDKFGALGKIAAITGTVSKAELVIDGWVMSCRAFSRRIEHQCLKYLFDKFGVDKIALEYESTSRNGPLREFLAGLVASPPDRSVRLEKRSFQEGAPRLFHMIEEVSDA